MLSDTRGWSVLDKHPTPTRGSYRPSPIAYRLYPIAYPPMYDISTFGTRGVAAVRISE